MTNQGKSNPDSIDEKSSRTLSLKTYRAATGLMDPLAKVALKQRLKRGKEDPDRHQEKRGFTNQTRPAGSLIWIHGASVGESLSVLPLVERLQTDTGASVLVTTTTVTSAELMSERLPRGAIHQYAPMDHPDYVNRFLAHWQPNSCIFVESEMWPNLIQLTSDQGIPMALVNGRISPSSYKKWKNRTQSIRSLMDRFSVLMGQDQANADRITELSGRTALMLGNLKMAAAPLPASAADIAATKNMIGSRPIWLAASTHAGEEEEIAEAHRRVKTKFPDLLTIIAPRHPERGEEISAILDQFQIINARRSLGEHVTDHTEAYIADTLGELGIFYRLSDIAFVGGSICKTGGHNPLEPARLGAAILYGPNIFNFAETYQSMRASGGTALVRNGLDLSAALVRLLTDTLTREEMAHRAERWSTANAESVLHNIYAALQPVLPNKIAAEK